MFFYKQGVADQQVDEFILPDNIDDCIWAVQKPIAQIYGQLLWVHVCVNACLPLYIWGSKSQDISLLHLIKRKCCFEIKRNRAKGMRSHGRDKAANYRGYGKSYRQWMFFNSFGIDLMKMEVGLWLCTCLNYDHAWPKKRKN